MTVPTTSSVWGPYAGNGVTTVFPYSGRIFTAADLVVTQTDPAEVETVKVLNTDYNISGVGLPNGGSVTMLVAPPAGYFLTLRRVLDIVQLTDIKNQGAFHAEIHEDVFDRLTMFIQQQQEQILRLLSGSEAAPVAGFVMTITGVSAGAASAAVLFATPMNDADYTILFLTPTWATQCIASDKTTNGFTVNFSIPSPGAETVVSGVV
jgi:hypothetical protein